MRDPIDLVIAESEVVASCMYVGRGCTEEHSTQIRSKASANFADRKGIRGTPVTRAPAFRRPVCLMRTLSNSRRARRSCEVKTHSAGVILAALSSLVRLSRKSISAIMPRSTPTAPHQYVDPIRIYPNIHVDAELSRATHDRKISSDTCYCLKIRTQ